MTSPEHWAWKNSLPTPPPSHFSLPRNNLEVRQERRLVTSTVWQLVPSVNLAGSRTPAIYASGHAWGWGGLLVGVRRPTHCGWHHFLARIVNCRKQRKHEHQLAFRSLCFLFADVMWPAASSSCFLLLQDGLHPWSGSLNKPFLPETASVRVLPHGNGKETSRQGMPTSLICHWGELGWWWSLSGTPHAWTPFTILTSPSYPVTLKEQTYWCIS